MFLRNIRNILVKDIKQIPKHNFSSNYNINRLNVFTLSHKAHRQMWAELMIKSGSCDYTSTGELKNLRDFLFNTCESDRAHSTAENEILNILRLKDPDLFNDWFYDLGHHSKYLDDMEKFVERIILEKNVDKKDDLGHDLYMKI
jgi:hypothetical protein